MQSSIRRFTLSGYEERRLLRWVNDLCACNQDTAKGVVTG